MTPEVPPVYRLATADDVARAGAAGPPETDAPQSDPAAGGPRRTGPEGARAWWRSRTVRVIAVVLAVFVGLPVAVVAVWVIRVTVQAGRGSDAPEATLITWVGSFEDPTAVDADRLVAPDSWPRLRQVRAELLAGMNASGLSPKIETGSPPAGQSWTPATVTGDEATWTDFYEMQWPLNESGTQSQSTQTLPWRARAHHGSDGWRLTDVQVPPWCGPGGYVPVCGPLTGPSSPVSAGPSGSPQPLVSPSDDLLRNPREMLPCGPRDPFPQWHDCPSPTPTR